MTTWSYVDTGVAQGAYNMAVDEVLLDDCANRGSGPYIRLFGWNPPTVSLGFGQDLERELDVEKCRRMGVDIVRRPTGGRAVLHWGELTYSVVCAAATDEVGADVGEVYHAIGCCLVRGLRLAGAEAVLERAGARRRDRQEADTSKPCFSSISRWEVKCGGRKLIGSAQRRLKSAVLQHGSLLLDPRHEKLLELMPEGDRAVRERYLSELQLGSTHLSACLESWSIADLKHRILEGFRQVLSVETQECVLDPDQSARVEALVRAKYGNPSWTFEGKWNRSARPISEELVDA
jgi:lipoate-protein ligase A